MFRRDPETSRRTVVEDIDCEALEADHFGEAINDIGNVIERVSELATRRHVRLSEARQIGRHEMKATGEMRDEVAEHVARAWETMKQQQRRRIRRPCLAIEDLQAVDVGGAIVDGSHWLSPSFRNFLVGLKEVTSVST